MSIRPADLSPVLSMVLETVRWSLQLAWQCARWWLLCTAGLYLALGLLPAAQVVLVQRVVGDLGSSSSGVWLPLLGLAVAVGLNLSLAQTALAATQRLALRMRLTHRSTVLLGAAAAGPVALAQADRIAELQAAQEAAEVVDTVPGDVIRLAGTTVTAAGLCVAVAAINPWSGVLIVVALLPTLAAFTRIARAEAREWPHYGAAERRAQYATEQLLQQRPATELSVLGSSSKVATIARRHRETSMRSMDSMIAVAMRWEMLAGAVTAILLAAALAILVLGRPSPAAAAAALTGTISGLGAIRSAGYAAGGILTAVPKSAFLRDRSHADPGSHRPVVSTVHRLRATGLTVRYPGSSSPALDHAAIEAERGEMIALVGVNGAGKTTLVNALRGVVAAGGDVTVDGHDLAGLAPTERLGYFGLLTQEFGRYEFTARETVGLGTPGGASDSAIRAALRGAEAHRVIEDLPDDLDSQLGQQWGGAGLSGGQWQRLALARIHLRGAGIWILDEPTSAIDAEAEEAIFAHLHQTRHERITIVVSHRAWTLRTMDRIYVLDGGRVVQSGTYPDLLQTPGRFATMFATQAPAGTGSRVDPR